VIELLDLARSLCTSKPSGAGSTHPPSGSFVLSVAIPRPVESCSITLVGARRAVPLQLGPIHLEIKPADSCTARKVYPYFHSRGSMELS